MSCSFFELPSIQRSCQWQVALVIFKSFGDLVKFYHKTNGDLRYTVLTGGSQGNERYCIYLKNLLNF